MLSLRGTVTWAIADGAGNGPSEPRPASRHGHRDRRKAVRSAPGLREAGAPRGTPRFRRRVSSRLTSGTWSQSVEDPFARPGVTPDNSRKPPPRQ
jgi:hypothetical protein